MMVRQTPYKGQLVQSVGNHGLVLVYPIMSSYPLKRAYRSLVIVNPQIYKSDTSDMRGHRKAQTTTLCVEIHIDTQDNTLKQYEC